MLLCQFVDTHDARGRGEEQPTILDVRAWAVANHVLNVVVEAVNTWVNTEDWSAFGPLFSGCQTTAEQRHPLLVCHEL